MAMATSYNWLFLWDKKHSINGVLLVLITNSLGHNCIFLLYIVFLSHLEPNPKLDGSGTFLTVPAFSLPTKSVRTRTTIAVESVISGFIMGEILSKSRVCLLLDFWIFLVHS